MTVEDPDVAAAGVQDKTDGLGRRAERYIGVVSAAGKVVVQLLQDRIAVVVVVVVVGAPS